MEAFNGFYYSWSPKVADSIRAHTGFGTLMKGVLYPLISVLQVSESLFTAFSFSAELGVVMAGFVASALLAAIYLAPIAVVLSHLRKYRPSRTVIMAMGLIWLASLTAIGLAELTQIASLMTISTGTFVLTTMGITLLSVIHHTPKLIHYIQNTRT
jgi:hypothetical protein